MPRVERSDKRPSNRHEGSDGHARSESQTRPENSGDPLRDSTLGRVLERIHAPFRSRQLEPATDSPPNYIDESPEAVRDRKEAELVGEIEIRKKALEERQGKEQIELYRKHLGSNREKGLITSYRTEKAKLDREHEKEGRIFALKEEKKLKKSILPPEYKDYNNLE